VLVGELARIAAHNVAHVDQRLGVDLDALLEIVARLVGSDLSHAAIASGVNGASQASKFVVIELKAQRSQNALNAAGSNSPLLIFGLTQAGRSGLRRSIRRMLRR